MNIPSPRDLKHLFKSTPVRSFDPVIAEFRGKYFVGHVLDDDAKDEEKPVDHFDIQWYKPHKASLGYAKETLFVPTMTRGKINICDFIHRDHLLPIGKYVEKEDPYGHEFKFTKPVPAIIQDLMKNAEEDEETITEEDEETSKEEETDDKDYEEVDSEWEEDEEECEESRKRSPPTDLPSPKRQKTLERMRIANLTTPSYPSIEKQKDVYKQQINDILAHLGRQTRMLCHTLNPAEPSCALFLDAQDARTTHTLFNTGGYRLENMFCPNYSQEVVDSIQRSTSALPGKVNTPCLLMEEFTLRETDRKFSFVWVDGCGSWKGSGVFSTQESVLNLFRHKMLDTHSVVAYTINMRGKKGNQVSRAHTEMAMSYRQIKMVAEQNGYTVEHKPKLHHVPTSHGDLPNCGQNFTAYMRVWK